VRDDTAMSLNTDELVEGLEGEEREARRKLLEHLHDEGFSAKELSAAVQEDRLALLPVERVLGGTHTAREIEEQTGLSAEMLLELRRRLGLPANDPDERQFGDEDIAMAKSTRVFLEAGLSDEAISEMTRVLGESMARLAATTASAFVASFLKAGDTEYDVAVRFAELAEELTPAVEPILVSAYNAHLREAVRRGMIGRAEMAAGSLAEAQEITVCFADLVGFTRMGGQVEAQELGGVAGKLAQVANEVVDSPVRLIKTIGDAAMFVSPDPGAMVAVALRLVDAAQEADLPSLRAGIAFGPALLRAGDYYGNSVNVASRVTGVGRPDSVLCTEDVHAAAEEDFEWSFAGKHRLKGVSESLPLYRARWPRPDDGQDSAKKARQRRRKSPT
jgi:adenylate cyclase